MTDTASWDLYQTFLAVLREGSLSAAARALGLTQPTVGRHVDALETSLGRELFVRSPSGLVPSEAALALRPHAEILASAAAALLRAASGAGDGQAVRGTVRLAASEIMGIEVLPPILAALGDRHPGLAVELALSAEVADLLRRDADVAVRMVEPAQKALVVRRLGTVRIGLHAHRRYLERHGTPRSFEDALDHRLIGFDRETAAIRSLQRRLPSLRRQMFRLRTDSDVAQLAMIRAGCGIGACQVALAARDRDLVRVLPRAFAFELPTTLAMHEDLRHDPACRAVFDALAGGLRAYLREQARAAR